MYPSAEYEFRDPRITRYRFLSAERRAFYQRPRVFRPFALEPQSPADPVRFTLRAFDLQLTMRNPPTSFLRSSPPGREPATLLLDSIRGASA